MILLVLALALKPTPEPDKGRYLYEECRAALVEHPTPEEIERGNICMAYFEGFIDGKGAQIKYECLSGVSYPKIVATYVGWMEKNPEGMRMTKRAGAEFALGMVLMCRAK